MNRKGEVLDISQNFKKQRYVVVTLLLQVREFLFAAKTKEYWNIGLDTTTISYHTCMASQDMTNFDTAVVKTVDEEGVEHNVVADPYKLNFTNWLVIDGAGPGRR